MAIAAPTRAVDRHLSTPRDVKVTNGFDFTQYVRPRLTTILSPAYETGLQGAALLLKRLSKGSFDQASLLLDVSLQPGDSD
jgi:LacI family transcriptional regulator